MNIKLLTAVLLLCSLIILGTTGYVIIEGDNILNSLYMTIITVSTVGFGEIHSFSVTGKIFTIILIILSISVYAYSITIITSFLLEGKIAYLIQGYRSKIRSKMENHVIICGYGRNGQQVARELEAHNQPFLVIEHKHEVIVKNNNKKIIFLEGDSTRDEILEKAHVKKAKALITTLPIDADNLYVVLAARSLNPGLTIISRASDESTEAKLKFAGVNNVVMPEKVGGAHMASLVTKPDVIEFLEHLSILGEDPTNLEEIECDFSHADGSLKTIGNLMIREKTGANIIGFKNPEGKFIMNPGAETTIDPGAKFFVLGTKMQILKTRELLQG